MGFLFLCLFVLFFDIPRFGSPGRRKLNLVLWVMLTLSRGPAVPSSHWIVRISFLCYQTTGISEVLFELQKSDQCQPGWQVLAWWEGSAQSKRGVTESFQKVLLVTWSNDSELCRVELHKRTKFSSSQVCGFPDTLCLSSVCLVSFFGEIDINICFQVFISSLAHPGPRPVSCILK